MKLWLVLVAGLGILGPPALALEVRVDFARGSGVVRPLHGINKGPLAAGGILDLTVPLRELSSPWTRLHDCQWAYPEVVDMHAIFRVPGADPDRSESYDFALTDAYLAALRGIGAGIVYRLGESIEHGPVKRFVHPPADMENWARACVGVVRHYNEGWANGTNHHISYWEIWNEPENRPQMWSGTDDDYIRLYLTTARALKKHNPRLKVGGPSLGYSGDLKNGQFTASAFARALLSACRREAVPLDFFSWHCYTADPSELAARARGVRRLLDEAGFAAAESHLNEWNYLPGNTWEPFSREARPEVRQKFYEEMGGAAGAAFVVTALVELQEAPVDMCNFYHAEPGAFGLFNEFGVPNRVYYALRAFAKTAALTPRAATEGAVPGKIAVLASGGPSRGAAAILLANFAGEASEFEVKIDGWSGPAEYKLWLIDTRQSWREKGPALQVGPGAVRLDLPAPGVAFIELTSPPK